MQVLANLSNRTLKELRPLISFVTRECKYSHLAGLKLSVDPTLEVTDGLANQFDLRSALTLALPSLVTLTLSDHKPRDYPIVSQHRKSVPAVTFKDWKEEFILVLAHELRHIDQFWQIEGPPRRYEVDAERFAATVLEKYRSR